MLDGVSVLVPLHSSILHRLLVEVLMTLYCAVKERDFCPPHFVSEERFINFSPILL